MKNEFRRLGPRLDDRPPSGKLDHGVKVAHKGGCGRARVSHAARLTAYDARSVGAERAALIIHCVQWLSVFHHHLSAQSNARGATQAGKTRVASEGLRGPTHRLAVAASKLIELKRLLE